MVITSAGGRAQSGRLKVLRLHDATPTIGQLQITPQKADAYLFGSFEVLSDSDFGQQLLPELLADAKDRIEETALGLAPGPISRSSSSDHRRHCGAVGFGYGCDGSYRGVGVHADGQPAAPGGVPRRANNVYRGS